MSRLPDIDTEHLTDEQAELYEALLSRPEVAKLGLIGPFGVWMHAPDLGKAMSALGGKVRFATSLPNNVTEVAICTTGAFHRAKFEFAAHRGLAIRAGVDEAALDRLAPVKRRASSATRARRTPSRANSSATTRSAMPPTPTPPVGSAPRAWSS